MSFEVLGFDIILDYKARPFLLEINHSPSFSTETPLDYKVKKHLITDTIALLNLNLERKRRYLKFQADELSKRVLTGKKTILTPQEREALRKRNHDERVRWEKNHVSD